MPPGLYNDPSVPSQDLLDMPSFGSSGNSNFGTSVNDGYTRKALMLSGQQAKAEDNAMNYLRQSLNSQMDISPEQGIAAAILAAIPSLGGYMIGKSVGKSKFNFADVSGTDANGKLHFANPGDLAPTGAMVGGAAGVEQGVALSDNYINSIEANNKYQGDILQKMGGIEEAKAARLANDALQFEKASLDSEQEQRRDERNFEQQKTLTGIQQSGSLANALAEIDYRNANPAEGKFFTPEAIAIAKAQGVDLTNVTPAQLNSINNMAAEGRRQEGQDKRLAGENLIPPSEKTKAQVEASLKMRALTDRYSNAIEQLKAKDPGAIGRTIASVLPQTEIGKLQQDLEQYAVAYRNAREPGIMTQEDFERAKAYVAISPLDTFESVQRRMQELKSVTDLELKATLTARKAGKENVSDYETLLGFTAPTTPGGSGKRLPGETKEQFTERRTQELLQGK